MNAPRFRIGPDAWFGAGVLLIVGVVQTAIALGFKLSKDQERVAPDIEVIVLVIALGMILHGVGVFRFLHKNIHLRWPITFGQARPVPQSAMGTQTNWTGEIALRDHEINELRRQLKQWGRDEVARKYLLLALNEFPDFQVAEMERIANMLYGAYKKPRTNIPLDIVKSLDGKTATISFWPFDGSIVRPFDQAPLYRDRIHKLVIDAQNTRIDESGVSDSGI